MLTLERLRNLIETDIDAGITLYTDHKPAVFENSLSNNGQLSGRKSLISGPLLNIFIGKDQGCCSRAHCPGCACAPTEGWFDPTLPAKLAALLDHLTIDVKNNEHIRIYCHQDTIAAARIVQRWRERRREDPTELFSTLD